MGMEPMNDTPMSFGERIKMARERRGMNAAQLASILSVSETTVNYWETSVLELPDEVTRKIIAVLDISPAFLLGDSENPEQMPITAKEPNGQHFPERRKRLLWLRDFPESNASSSGGFAPEFRCLSQCNEMLAALKKEGRSARREDLEELASVLEKSSALVNELLKRASKAKPK